MVTRGGSESITPQQIGGVWEDDNKIVVGIDIGTTQSGVALAFLEKGSKQEFYRVQPWPGLGAHEQGAKIPTVIWYNLETKKAELFGAEATSTDGGEIAADNKWFLAKHFKLHLQPKELRKAEMTLDPLPAEISLSQIYSDFLGYLLKRTKAFVEQRMANGKKTWEKYKPSLEVVIAHPNGWSTPQQDFLRKAAIDSGFVDLDKAPSHVKFVTEAEASVHFCIHHSNLSKKLEIGTNLAVCDAGGSTVDTTLYSVVSTTPVLRLRELRMSDSIQAGGILVNIKFEEFIHKALEEFELPSSELEGLTTAGVEHFETFAKRNFGNLDGSELISVKVANTGNYSGSPITIRRGSMKVPSSIIKECFDACARPILSSVGEQLENQSVQHILLVGGFGDSPYLHTEFERHFESDSCEVVLANDFTSKAVADGAVIWNILCSVVSRTPRRSFGMICASPCLPWMPEAEGRTAFIGPQGVPLIPGKWVQIAKKGVPVDAEETFRNSFHRSIMEASPVTLSLSVEVFGYSGDDEPTWAKDPEGQLIVPDTIGYYLHHTPIKATSTPTLKKCARSRLNCGTSKGLSRKKRA